MSRVTSYDVSELEARIGPRGTTLVNSDNRALVQNWLVANGFPAVWAKRCRVSTLWKAYNKPRYFQALELAKAEGRLGSHDLESENESSTPREESAVLPAQTTIAPLGTASGAFVLTAPEPVAKKPTPDRTATAAQLADLIASLTARPDLDEDRVVELIREHAPTLAARRIEIHRVESGELADLGLQHKLFADLLTICNTRLPDGNRLNVWLSGPAGSGKTTAAANVAKALDLPFYFNGAIDNEYKLLGFTDANGRLVSRPFRQAFEHGGVYLFDEIDASLPSAVLAFNAATANGHCDFPDKIVQRHPDCVLIAAGNTFGHGANAEYVGRMRQDAAFLDRFVTLAWEYDEDMERALCPNRDWCERVIAIRAKAQRQGLKVIVSPRASYFGAALLASGMPRAKVEAMTIRKGMTDDQWAVVS